MAAGMGDALEGAKILTLFGLGTLPALLGFGLLTRMLSNTMTRRFIHASGMILIALGAMMLNRGLTRILA
jgi:sulfite exporter TauE/SafE